MDNFDLIDTWKQVISNATGSVSHINNAAADQVNGDVARLSQWFDDINGEITTEREDFLVYIKEYGYTSANRVKYAVLTAVNTESDTIDLWSDEAQDYVRLNVDEVMSEMNDNLLMMKVNAGLLTEAADSFNYDVPTTYDNLKQVLAAYKEDISADLAYAYSSILSKVALAKNTVELFNNLRQALGYGVFNENSDVNDSNDPSNPTIYGYTGKTPKEVITQGVRSGVCRWYLLQFYVIAKAPVWIFHAACHLPSTIKAVGKWVKKVGNWFKGIFRKVFKKVNDVFIDPTDYRSEDDVLRCFDTVMYYSHDMMDDNHELTADAAKIIDWIYEHGGVTLDFLGVQYTITSPKDSTSWISSDRLLIERKILPLDIKAWGLNEYPDYNPNSGSWFHNVTIGMMTDLMSSLKEYQPVSNGISEEDLCQNVAWQLMTSTYIIPLLAYWAQWDTYTYSNYKYTTDIDDETTMLELSNSQISNGDTTKDDFRTACQLGIMGAYYGMWASAKLGTNVTYDYYLCSNSLIENISDAVLNLVKDRFFHGATPGSLYATDWSKLGNVDNVDFMRILTSTFTRQRSSDSDPWETYWYSLMDNAGIDYSYYFDMNSYAANSSTLDDYAYPWFKQLHTFILNIILYGIIWHDDETTDGYNSKQLYSAFGKNFISYTIGGSRVTPNISIKTDTQIMNRAWKYIGVGAAAVAGTILVAKGITHLVTLRKRRMLWSRTISYNDFEIPHAYAEGRIADAKAMEKMNRKLTRKLRWTGGLTGAAVIAAYNSLGNNSQIHSLNEILSSKDDEIIALVDGVQETISG